MNKLFNAKLGIFLATATLLFAILAFMLMNVGVAWFASSLNVNANSFSVTVQKGHSMEAFLSSYPISEINYDTNVYTVERVEGKESYTLPIDDEHSISYSEYKKALAVIVSVVSDEAQTIRIELDASSNFETIGGNSNFISNCMQISSATLNGAVAEKGTFTDRFITLGDTPSKKGVIDLGEYEIVQGTTEICFLIEYDPNLLKYISGQVLNSGSGNAIINYSNDIKFYIHP